MNNDEAIKEIRRLLNLYDPIQNIFDSIAISLFNTMNMKCNEINGISDIIIQNQLALGENVFLISKLEKEE